MKAMTEDGKRLMHANIELFGVGPNPPPIQAHICVKGGGEVMMHDEFPEFGKDVLAPSTIGSASMTINVNRPQPSEVDAIVARAAAAGATVILEPQDVFWGCRYGKVRDPFGHVWAFNAPLKRA